MPDTYRILIVDDEAIAALSLRLELNQAGYPYCQIEGSGERAVRAALQQPFGAILMDLHLAGKLSGLEAARQIRAAGQATPIIFMSGYTDPEHRAGAATVDPIAYLVKPIHMAELLQILEQVLPPPEAVSED